MMMMLMMMMHGVVLAVLTCKVWCSMTRDCKRWMWRSGDIVMLDWLTVRSRAPDKVIDRFERTSCGQDLVSG